MVEFGPHIIKLHFINTRRTVDAATGRYAGTFRTFALCGYVRQKGEADQALNTLIARADAAAVEA